MHIHARLLNEMIPKFLFIALVPLCVILSLVTPQKPSVSSFPSEDLKILSFGLRIVPLGVANSFNPREDQPAACSIGSIPPNPNPMSYYSPGNAILNMMNTASRPIEMFFGNDSLGYLETDRPQRITFTTSAPYAIGFKMDPNSPHISLIIPEAFQAYLTFLPDGSFRVKFVPCDTIGGFGEKGTDLFIDP